LAPDTYELGKDEFQRLKRAGRPRLASSKVAVTIRYAKDVIEAFEAGGPGWQTRINEVLKQAVADGVV